ncbi:hypothetical protein FMUND_12426 [Fusarium mundagurra]|uniref:C2H2-type domain-containing protein n=1 Tax=Fusarium mundagurra TaxID=1567541 RepID=A0A8H5Y4K4_9HYPO|nr:hypothetical protein FMUND_12426 [Fusarium mundagurra]
MNVGSREPRQVAGELVLQRPGRDQSPQPGRGANKRRERDGPRYPHGKDEIESFECPFSKHDPHRYEECRGHRLTRVSDVTQHIKRRHLLVEVNIDSDRNVREEDIVLYCPECRDLFRGRDASRKLRVHSTDKPRCQRANIKQTGVTLPREFEALLLTLRSNKGKSEEDRWYIIWDFCFPEERRPGSPYVEISVPRQQMESILCDAFRSIRGAQSIITRAMDKIYKTSPPPGSSSFVPPQPQPNSVQTAPAPTYKPTSYPPSNPAFTSQPMQPQTQGFNHNSGQPSAGVPATPNTFTNYSAPSPVPAFGAYTNSGNNIIPPEDSTVHDSGYPYIPYGGHANASFQSESQDKDFANTYWNYSPHF